VRLDPDAVDDLVGRSRYAADNRRTNIQRMYNQAQMRLIFAAFPSLNDAYCEFLNIKVAFAYWMLPLYLASLSWNIFCGSFFK
jgi:hypothetical protein